MVSLQCRPMDPWRRRTDRVDWVLLTFLLSMLLAASVHHFFGLNALVVGFVRILGPAACFQGGGIPDGHLARHQPRSE